jgi:hypothetical protein
LGAVVLSDIDRSGDLHRRQQSNVDLSGFLA